MWPFKRHEQKASAVGPLIFVGGGAAKWSNRDYRAFADQGYRKNLVAYRAISIVARAVASVPWVLFRRETEIGEHPLLDLLMRPNPMMGGSEFFEAVTAFHQIAGNSYVEASGSTRAAPSELYPLRPDRVFIEAGKTGFPAKYTYRAAGGEFSWDVDQLTGTSAVLHLKAFNPLDDWYGMSPIEAASWSIDIRNETDRWNKALLQHDARPAGAFIPMAKDGMVGTITDEQAIQLREDIDTFYAGASNAGRPMILTSAMDYKQMSINPKDMDWINAKHTTATDIAQAFGVPPQILGIPGSQTFANMEQARLFMWEDTVIPLLGHLRSALNTWLVPQFDDTLRLDNDLDQVPALGERRRQHFEMLERSDYLTINEKRVATGYEPIDDGDVVLVPATMVPIGMSGMVPPGPGTEDDDDDDGEPPEEEAARDLGDLAYKLFLTPDGANRQREAAVQIRLQDAFEKRLRPRLARLIDARARAAAANVAGGNGRVGIEIALRGHSEEIGRELAAHVQAVMNTFGRRVMDAAQKDLAPDLETKDVEGEFTRRILAWIEEFGAAKVTAIAETTRSQIRAALVAGEGAGEALSAIAKRIRQGAGGVIARARADLIARTETHTASVAAQDIALQALDLGDLEREWIAVEDARVRPSHADADGQRRRIGEPFDIGGAKLAAPGDPRGPADEVIGCRCALASVVPN